MRKQYSEMLTGIILYVGSLLIDHLVFRNDTSPLVWGAIAGLIQQVYRLDFFNRS